MSAPRRLALRAAAAVAIGVLLLAGVAPARAAEPTPEERLLAKAQAIVILRGVFELKLAMGGQEQAIEIKSDAMGAVVDPSGLILALDPDAVAKRLQGSLQGLSVTIRTKSVKAVAPDGTEKDVVQVVRDGVLGLGFLQILDPGAPMAFVDLSAGGELATGAHLLGLKRLSRGFDHAPIVERCYVTHRLEKPRLVWSVSGDFDEMGLPVFDREGRPVGVLGFQQSSEAVALDDVASSFLPVALPLEPVRRALEQAKKRVPEAIAKAKASLEAGKDGEEAPMAPGAPKIPATPEAPEGPKPPDVPKGPETPKSPDVPKSPDGPK